MSDIRGHTTECLNRDGGPCFCGFHESAMRANKAPQPAYVKRADILARAEAAERALSALRQRAEEAERERDEARRHAEALEQMIADICLLDLDVDAGEMLRQYDKADDDGKADIRALHLSSGPAMVRKAATENTCKHCSKVGPCYWNEANSGWYCEEGCDDAAARGGEEAGRAV